MAVRAATFPGSADVRVRLTRSPTRVLRRGDRVTVVALVRARKGKGLRPKIAVKSLRGFRLRSSSVGGPSPRRRRVCPIDGPLGTRSPTYHVLYKLKYVGRKTRPKFSVRVTLRGQIDSHPATTSPRCAGTGAASASPGRRGVCGDARSGRA